MSTTTTHWTIAGIAATLIIMLSIPFYAIHEKSRRSSAEAVKPPAARFVGSESCRDCHRTQYDEWKGSHHQLAMARASDETVLGDFSDTEFRWFDQTTRFYRKDGRFMVSTRGPGGEAGEFEITHTFGWYPLQQYLVPFPGGRLQCLPIAWDSRDQLWYHLYPDRELAADDWLYWTNNGQNWNGMCAECHSTDLRKNYDPVDGTYATVWSEISVGCEACHGAGSDHLAWAQLPEMGRPETANAALTVITGDLTSSQQIQLCAPCHARRMSLDDNIHAHADFLDYGVPQLLSEGMYFPDGQILDEVYVYGSFMQSKMHARNVRCSDCHDVHSIKRIADGNDLCLQCHRAAIYDTRDHHFHKQTGEPGEPIRDGSGKILFDVGSGARCEGCHMPGRIYMGVDYRPDHSFRIPRPDLSLQLATPNACNRCHADNSVQWSLDAMAKWYGGKKRPHYGTLLAAGRRQDPGALTDLIHLAGDRLYPDIVRATALSLVSSYSDPAAVKALEQALTDESALLRHTAVSQLAVPDPQQRIAQIGPLLYDPVRAVRIEAARGLAGVSGPVMQSTLRQPYQTALDEYIAAMQRTGDFATSRHNMGNLYADLGQTDRAIDQYRKAIAIDGQFYPAKVNLAMQYNATGQKKAAQALLREVVDQYPDLYAIKYSLGLLLAEQQAFDEAVVYLKDAAAGLPQRSRIHYNLALLLQRLNRRIDAEMALNQALAVDPENPDYLYALAVLYLESNRSDDALKIAVRLRKSHPDLAIGSELANYIERSSENTH
ncbi:MAG: tetratricopeptide repeat protein [Desulfosarcina sp.]